MDLPETEIGGRVHYLFNEHRDLRTDSPTVQYL